MPYLHGIWSCLLQLGIATSMLYSVLGPAAFAGLGIMVAMLPLNVWVGKKQAGLIEAMCQRLTSSCHERVVGR